jgi:hypothetical protein
VAVALGVLLRFHPLRQLAQIAFPRRAFTREHAALVRVVADAQTLRIGADRRVRRRFVVDDRQAWMRQRLVTRALAGFAVFSQGLVLPLVNSVAAIVECDLARLAGLLLARRHDARSQPQTQLFQFVFQRTFIPKSGQQSVNRRVLIEVRHGSRNKT